MFRAVGQTNRVDADRQTHTETQTNRVRYDPVLCQFSPFCKGVYKLESEFLHSVDLQVVGEYSLHCKLLLECNTASEICVVLEFYAT